ncbi:UNVERIFIED_CONTAM: hypothetical protein PYX00_001256 [Menopon gallinae]|uniref:Uncharacterized protein n=1 Tax=Menopon gallinae TaxID=328185 RepID=A0AAW2IC67_9NEOP
MSRLGGRLFSLVTAALVSSVCIAEYRTQPLDAILYIDGVPAYLRLTNSTSLEKVYTCVLETSQKVNSVAPSDELKGMELDVGHLETSAGDLIRHLTEKAARNGRELWSSHDEFQLFKARLAHFLTMNYYNGSPVLDPDLYKTFVIARDNFRGEQSRLPTRQPFPVTESEKYPQQKDQSLKPQGYPYVYGSAEKHIDSSTSASERQPTVVAGKMTVSPAIYSTVGPQRESSVNKELLPSSRQTIEPPEVRTEGVTPSYNGSIHLTESVRRLPSGDPFHRTLSTPPEANHDSDSPPDQILGEDETWRRKGRRRPSKFAEAKRRISLPGV